MNDDDLSNASATHFVINVDNSRSLGFAGETDVRYADMVNGGEDFMILARL